jgi:hypothetical protein
MRYDAHGRPVLTPAVRPLFEQLADRLMEAPVAGVLRRRKVRVDGAEHHRTQHGLRLRPILQQGGGHLQPRRRGTSAGHHEHPLRGGVHTGVLGQVVPAPHKGWPACSWT